MLTVVVGGQAGSEGKGAIAAALHKQRKYGWAVRVGGPNAGHTVVGGGEKIALRTIPVAAVADPDCKLVVAAGSEIDLQVLYEEVELLEYKGFPVRERLYVDPEATLITQDHMEREAGIGTGTTGKGIGAARADRLLRGADRLADNTGALGVVEQLAKVEDTQELLRMAAMLKDPILIEGTQGYVLGSHAGHYPFCTSGNCRAIDFMAQAGLPPMEAEVVVVLRTYPIRIAGNSGELAEETTWDAIGVEPEQTTVTKKTRRVGGWNATWAREALRANGRKTLVVLTFFDYWFPELADCGSVGALEAQHLSKLAELHDEGIPVHAVGTGPDTVIWLNGEGRVGA